MRLKRWSIISSVCVLTGVLLCIVCLLFFKDGTKERFIVLGLGLVVALAGIVIGIYKGRCPSCGAQVRPYHRKCPRCGAQLLFFNK